MPQTPQDGSCTTPPSIQITCTVSTRTMKSDHRPSRPGVLGTLKSTRETTMNRQAIRSVLMAALLAFVAIGAMAPSSQAVTTASFHLPFPCGQSWRGDSDNSSAHRGSEIDFNRGSTATADLGDTVVASASGTVTTASYQTTNGYGNYVVLDHGDGWTTHYAHLKQMAVKRGEKVLRGQALGALGNTSRTNPGISPHLHFEVRRRGALQRAYFGGVAYSYPDATVTSKNCATLYDPKALCGAGFQVIDSRALGALGTVNLGWKASTKQNCVTTLKFSSTGTATYVTAYLKPAGATTVQDAGRYFVYAGPVQAVAPTCVTWGGTIITTTYNSPSEHC